jgi:hypothetical protein
MPRSMHCSAHVPVMSMSLWRRCYRATPRCMRRPESTASAKNNNCLRGLIMFKLTVVNLIGKTSTVEVSSTTTICDLMDIIGVDSIAVVVPGQPLTLFKSCDRVGIGYPCTGRCGTLAHKGITRDIKIDEIVRFRDPVLVSRRRRIVSAP